MECLWRAVAVGPGIAIIKYPKCSILASVGPSILTHTDGCSGGIVGWGDGPWPPNLCARVPCQAGPAPFILAIAWSIFLATVTCLSSPTLAGLCLYVQFGSQHLPRRLKLPQSPLFPIWTSPNLIPPFLTMSMTDRVGYSLTKFATAF
jgi:hypothetical protein